MTSGDIAYSTSGAVATIALDRPAKLNAFTTDTLHKLCDTFDRAAQDDGIRVVLLTGRGRAFSAGQDLSAVRPGETDLGQVLERDYRPLILRLMACPKITVAALNGPAVGAGANIALACDIVVAAASSHLQQVFVRIGLIPDVAGTWLLPRMVGIKRALALALTGDAITADEAQAMGLVYRVFPDAELAAKADAFAHDLAQASPTACRLIKDAFRTSLENDIETQLKLEAELQRQAGQSPEFRAAVEAFLSRRAARDQ